MSPSALWTLVILAGCVGWTTGLAIEGVPPPYLAVVAGLTVLEMEAFRRLDAVRGRLMAVGELAGLLVIAVGPYLVLSVVISTPVGTVLAGVAVAFLVWLMASITATDLEALVEPTDLIEGLSGPAGRLAGRLWLVGLGLTVVVVVAHGSLAPVMVARPIQAAMVIPYLTYWLVGLAALSAIHRSRNLARWQRDQAQVDPDLRSRWSGATHISLATAAVLVALLWWPAGELLTAAHAVTSGVTSAVSGWLTRILNPGRTPLPNRVLPAVESTLPEAPPPSRLIDPPPEWWDFIVILAIGVFFALTYTLLTRRSRRAGVSEGIRGRWLRAFIALLRTIGGTFVALLRSLIGIGKRQPPRGSDHEPLTPPRPRIVWVPSDRIRRRIAAEYRAFVSAATEQVGTPRLWETTAEYGQRVNERLDNEPAVTDLSGLYAEARFSAHELADEQADSAETWRKRIDTRFAEDKSSEPKLPDAPLSDSPLFGAGINVEPADGSPS